MRERVEHGQVEREGLAARGARGDDHVALPRRPPGVRLVRVELLDSRQRERLGQRRMELVGQRDGPRAAGPKPRLGDDLLAPGRVD